MKKKTNHRDKKNNNKTKGYYEEIWANLNFSKKHLVSGKIQIPKKYLKILKT